MSEVQASASLAAATPNWGEDDELFLQESEKVAAVFVSLVLEGELAAQPVGKSPATNKIQQGGSKAQGASRASQIAGKLKAIGDDFDARVNKEIEEATADVLKNLSIYQLGMEQFNHLCQHVLRKCSAQMKSGWQQVSAVYMTAGQVVRQLHSDQPQGQPHDVVQRRQTMFQSFTGQYMRDVGLETWVQNHGGMSAVLELSAPGEDMDLVPISDDEQ